MRRHQRTNNRHRFEVLEGLERRLVMSGPDLSIGNVADLTNYSVGETVHYTITVQNLNGADPILTSTPITMTDLAALGLSNVSASASSGWSFTSTSPTNSPDLITGTYTGAYPIAAGQSLPTITVTGTANGAVVGVLANVATISVLGDLDLTNNTATVDVGIIVPAVPSTLTLGTCSGTYGGTTEITASLDVGVVPAPNETIDFHMGSTDLGTAVTNALGIASLPAVSLAGFDAGTVANEVTASFAGDLSFMASNSTANLVVTPAPLTVTANNLSKVYGAALPALTLSYSGFVNGDTWMDLISLPTPTTTATAASHVANSPYTISVGGGSDPNYTMSYVAGALSVTPAPLTIAANNLSKVYGAALPALTASYNGLVNGDTANSLGTPPTLTTNASSASHVANSPYSISVGGATDADYIFNYVAGALTVTPAPLTITPTNLSKVYGASVPALTATYAGLVNGDTANSLGTPPTLTTNATSASHVADGPYAITAAGAADADYAFNYVAGALTVTPATLTITPTNLSKVYGASVPALTATYAGLVNGDTANSLGTPPTLTTNATSASHVANSPYSIIAAGAADADYAFNYVAGALSVTPAPLTIAANNLSKVYGAALPALTASYNGLVNGDTANSLGTPPTLTTNASSASHVANNPYSISVGGATDADYIFNYVAGALTVTPAPLTITPTNLSKVYGASVPALTATYAGLVNGDTANSLDILPTLTTNATSASHVADSPYSIIAAGASDADYAINYVAGALTVTPATLTITADDLSKVYGAALPTLTATYAGLVNGDTSSSLDILPTLTTAATSASHVASSPYPIVPDGAADADYAINYVAGALTVTPAPLMISANYLSKVYGAALPTLTATYAGLVNGDTSNSLNILPTLTTTATSASHVADSPYPITAAGAADADYAINYVAGALTVTPAPLMVTADDLSKVYGAAVPTLTATYGGLVNGDTSSSLDILPTLTTAATSASHVADGPFAITADGADDPDYAISYVAGVLTITPATLMVTPNDATKSFGNPTPALSATYSGFANDDTASSLTTPVVLSTTATPFSVIGQYPITGSGGSSPDYTIDYGQGTLTVTGDPSNSAFVTALYQDLLHRNPDAGGLDTFVADLESGVSKLVVTSDIYQSTEAGSVRTSENLTTDQLGPQEIDLVIALYQDILNRFPDAGGLNGWIARFEGGENAAQVASDVYNSSEAVADRANGLVTPSPGVPTDLITGLYEDILGRAPDTGGLNLFLGKLPSEGAAGVAADLYNSAEAVTYRSDIAFVTTLYQDLLHRSPDAGGLATFVTDLEAGQGRLAVTSDLYNSSEAASIRSSASMVTDPLGPKKIDVVIALYEDVLNRDPVASELVFWTGRMTTGETASGIASDIEGSSEAASVRMTNFVPAAAVKADLVTALYEDILSRPPGDSEVAFWTGQLDDSDGKTIASEIYNAPEAVADRNNG